MSLKFAVVGCGKIGVRHIEQILKVGTLEAVCDIDKKRLDFITSTHKVRSYLSLTELLKKEKNLDVIAICTPNGLHATHCIQSFKKGLHVICEKPLAITIADGKKIIKSAKKANKILFPVKQNRYNPPVVAVKNALDTSVLGKIYSIQLSCFWNRNEEYYKNSWKGSLLLDGGTLFTQFSHFIDLICWLFGDVKRVSAITKNFAHQQQIEFEDTGVVTLEFISGAIGTINYTVNSFEKNMEGSLTIIAENGTVKIGGQYLNELEYQNIKNYTLQNLPKGNAANSYENYTGSMSNHNKVYENVVDVLTNNGLATTSGDEALKAIEIISKIYKSAKKNTVREL